VGQRREGRPPEADQEATLHLKRPQPALLALLASGDTPIYPCHVSPRDMRQHPIGTGPFKFVEYKPNQNIKLARNPDYWKPGRPYLDGVEYTIIPNRSTAILAFIAGKFDMTFPYEVTIPLLRDIQTQSPQAICEVGMASESIGVLVNRTGGAVRQCGAAARDGAGPSIEILIDILGQGEGEIGGALMPPPQGVWGMPPEMVQTLPGYGETCRRTARRPGPSCRSSATAPTSVSRSRSRPATSPSTAIPAAILIDQLKEIYIDGELETIETANWVP